MCRRCHTPEPSAGQSPGVRRGHGIISLVARTSGRRSRRNSGQSSQTGRACRRFLGHSRALRSAGGHSSRPIDKRLHVSKPLSQYVTPERGATPRRAWALPLLPDLRGCRGRGGGGRGGLRESLTAAWPLQLRGACLLRIRCRVRRCILRRRAVSETLRPHCSNTRWMCSQRTRSADIGSLGGPGNSR